MNASIEPSVNRIEYKRERLSFQGICLLVDGLSELGQEYESRLFVMVKPLDGLVVNPDSIGLSVIYETEKIRGFIGDDGITVTLENRTLSRKDFQLEAAKIKERIINLVDESQQL